MGLDLSMLDDAPLGIVPANQVDVVLALRLDEVEEDAEQPRQKFDAEELESLATSIRQRGVQAPIIVRPKAAGIYRIIHGSRRYRASKLAGKDTIPAIVKANVRLFDDYSQIVENQQRANLAPMEIAHFIRKRQGAGDSNKVIAQQLCMIPASVTWHLALLSAAEPILMAFQEGRITGAEQVYHLQRLYEQQSQAVEAFLATSPDITQRMIRDLSTAIAGETGATEDTKQQPDIPDMPITARDPNSNSDMAASASSGVHAKTAISRKSADSLNPTRFKRPALRATYDDQTVILQLFRRPSSPEYAFVTYEHDGDEEEVELALLSGCMLIEGA